MKIPVFLLKIGYSEPKLNSDVPIYLKSDTQKLPKDYSSTA